MSDTLPPKQSMHYWRSIRVATHTIKIWLVDGLVNYPEHCYGQWRPDKHWILLDSKLTERMKMKILFHEWLHAVMDLYGMEPHTETIVRVFDECFAQAFPGWFREPERKNARGGDSGALAEQVEQAEPTRTQLSHDDVSDLVGGQPPT